MASSFFTATPARERLALGLLLAATFATRAIHPGQPIVENYVGRQIPTAMVARNLDRGSGFLHPELDTGPFPNRFLVEPPIYAFVVVAARRALAIDLEPAGRLVSAGATAVACWGLFGLVRRREGPGVALLSVAAFSAFPVMVRYGRAFQPDALMLGGVLAGLRGWDQYEATGDRRWAAFGGFVLALGLALKITTAWALIPFALIVRRQPIATRLALAMAMLCPAMAWYGYAWGEVHRPGSGSLASSDNAAIWLRGLGPGGWLRLFPYPSIARDLTIRAFTPAGFVLAAWGVLGVGALDRAWKGWGVGCVLSVLALSPKWHHGYYWMVVAPVAAVGVARGLVDLRARGGRVAALAVGSSFLAMGGLQSASTFRTLAEWSALSGVAREVRSLFPPDRPIELVAPEALLYHADRRGFRLEFDPGAARRAAGEWGEPLPDADRPMALVRFYRRRAAGRLALADVGRVDGDPTRRAWREAVRGDPEARVLVDRPDALIAEFP